MTPLADFNAGVQRARDAYYSEPVAVCTKCRAGLHRRCTYLKDPDGSRWPCPCSHFDDDFL